MLSIIGSSKKRHIVVNFAYGTGPYLRTTDLAIAFNGELEKRGHPRMGIIVPWLYGERQREVMLERFSSHERKHPREIFLDPQLGTVYRKVFYGTHSYEESLRLWVDRCLPVSRETHHYLKGNLSVETLTGEKLSVHGSTIAIEINRSPRLRYAVAPSYFTSFASIGEILEKAIGIEEIKLNQKLLLLGARTATFVEDGHKKYFLAEPATFSHLKKRTPRFEGEIASPPIAPLPGKSQKKIQPGIYVTVTGIPGLERLYAEARSLGLTLYSNVVESVPGSTRALPSIIPNKDIRLHFARSGWSSVWISMICGTPFVAPPHDPYDDPEIYFNNCSVEKLKLGSIFRGQSLQEILSESTAIKDACKEECARIIKKFGTLDGNAYCARLIADHFLSL